MQPGVPEQRAGRGCEATGRDIFLAPAPGAGLRLQGATLAVRTPGQMARDHGLFAGKVMERMVELKKARLPGGRAAAPGPPWLARAARRVPPPFAPTPPAAPAPACCPPR